ncbi:unnamed protein product [Rotaria sordida]|uniref:G-protein coupled receptors family 1 profile domain-containing protein n=1 Tax=Rotaria sordida TaxID=392033 RepID=A0A813U5Y2_9BILA|nr:unnamed protein product [Rotaria sordida]
MANNESLPIDFDEFVKLTNISHWIYRVWTILYNILGITGNIFALFIFIHWTKRLSLYIYFSFLCIINILVIFIDMNYHFLIPFTTNSKILIENFLPKACKCIFFLTYFFRYLFIWIIVMINIDRCLYLSEHSFRKILCQQRTAKIICCILILFSFFANFHFLIYFNQPIITQIPTNNTCFIDGLLCHCKTSHPTYRVFWKTIWPIYNLIIFAIIPLFIIIICCILIIRNIYLTRKNIYGKRHDSDVSVKSKNDHLHSITKTLICLDLLFPITIFPTLFLQIYVNYNAPKTCLKIGTLNLIFSIGFAMIYIKNTFAFFIFYLTGQKFRRAFSALVHGRKISDSTDSH